MTLSRLAACGGIVACVCVSLTIDGAAQARGGRSTAAGQAGRIGPPSPPPAPAPTVADDPFSGPVVTGAPFSADATTIVTQVLGDGTRIEQTSTARFYRDGAGRVRREQTILGLDALNPSGEPRTAVTIDPDPDDGLAYTLDTVTRTARRVPRSAMAYLSALGELTLYLTNTTREGRQVALGITLPGDQLNAGRRVRTRALDTETTGAKPVEESLGTRQIEGVPAVGRRTTSVIPTGQIGNDRPIEIVDERWESPELRLLVRSLHRDPRTGDVEYRLTNILRVEPPPDLFMVPPGYTIEGQGTVGGRVGGPDTPGGRGGGGGRRSGGGGQ